MLKKLIYYHLFPVLASLILVASLILFFAPLRTEKNQMQPKNISGDAKPEHLGKLANLKKQATNPK